MLSEREIIDEFKQRRSNTLAASRNWVLLAVVGFVGGAFVGDLDANSSLAQWNWAVLFFSLAAISILRLVFIFRANYHCPSCGELPVKRSTVFGPGSFGIEEDIDLDPMRCSHCGVRLK